MKKQFILAAALVLMLTACQNGGKDVWNSAETSESASETEETSRAAETESSPETDKVDEEDTEKQNPILPLNVELSAEYEGEWDDKGAIITADSSTVYILDDGYDALQETLDAYNKETWQEVYTTYMENREWAKEEAPDDEYYISRKIEISRADTKVLSFVSTEVSYVGGAHGSYYEAGENFDPETGKALELSDVATDYDALYEYVKTSLREDNEKEVFFEQYEDWLYDMFYEPDSAMASPLEWNLTQEGLRFRFNPYVIGPWSSGTFYVEVPYDGNESLIREEYAPAKTNGSMTKLSADTPFYLDVDGDGTEEIFTFSTEAGQENYGTRLTFTRRETEDGAELMQTEESYGAFTDAYLVKTGSGRAYLYVEFQEDNDFRTLKVLDLAPEDEDKVIRPAGDFGYSVYGHYVYDPEHFSLYSRLDALGTYSGYREYSVGEDGLPVPSENRFTIVNYFEDYPYVLTAKREIDVRILEDGSAQAEEATLPKGTTFRLTATDGETYVEAELEDGRKCEIPIKKEPDEFLYTINGVSESDCFDGLRYAG